LHLPCYQTTEFGYGKRFNGTYFISPNILATYSKLYTPPSPPIYLTDPDGTILIDPDGTQLLEGE
jgi:hypothetical protein